MPPILESKSGKRSGRASTNAAIPWVFVLVPLICLVKCQINAMGVSVDPKMTVLGLLIAVFGPLLVASVGMRSDAGGLTPHLLGLAALLAIVGCVLLIVFFCEDESLSSLGLLPFGWQSAAWGLGLAAFFMTVFAPVTYWALKHLGLGGFEAGLAKTAALPDWFLTLAIAVGATSEEILYRGYAVERIATLTGSYWIAGIISVLIFGIAHVPMWGWGPALSTVCSGAVLTVFFIWRRDLTANVIAHVLTDFVGIAVVPLLS